MNVDDLEGSVHVVEVDNFDGLARVLKEVRKAYPVMQGDAEWESKLKYAVDLCTNCLYLYYTTQQMRLALQKEIFSSSMDFPTLPEDDDTKH